MTGSSDTAGSGSSALIDWTPTSRNYKRGASEMTASGKTIGRVPTNRVMTLSRVLDAPRELVWEVYTQPEHMVHWLASRDWTTPSARNELRTGGTFKIEMRELNGHEGFFFEGTYDEVRKPELLVQVIGDGRIMRTTFEDLGGKKTK